MAPVGTGPYGWSDVSPARLEALVGHMVAVIDTQGAEHKGMVEHVRAGTLRLRRARMDGGDVVEVRLADVRDARVFGQSN